MKLVQVNFHFEYADVIDEIVERNGVTQYVRHPRVVGYDSDGKHDGTQVFPGNTAVIQALVEEDRVDGLLGELARFRAEKRAHQHLEAFVVPVERQLSEEHPLDGQD
jgi:hypothetical protein